MKKQWVVGLVIAWSLGAWGQTNYATVAGGLNNSATGFASTVSGGVNNDAIGYASTVPGGEGNIAAGTNSFAAGYRAIAADDGTFVWADSSDTNEFWSVTNNEFAVRAAGGLRLADGRFIGDGSGLTNLDIESLGGTLGAINLPTSGEWDASGVTVTLQDVIAELSTMTNVTLSGEVLATVISNLQQQVTETYVTQNSITVQVTEDEVGNGAALIAAYAAATNMNPSVTNRIVVIVPPGRYDLSTNGLLMDTEYIDLVGLTTDRAAQYLYGTPGEYGGVIKQAADFVCIENLTLFSQSELNSSNISHPAAYFPTVPGSNTVVRNCEFIPVDVLASTRSGVEYAGFYEYCVAGGYAFGGENGTASGIFIDCHVGAQGFGGYMGIASGTFINCTAVDHSFGGNGSASGIFVGCRAGRESFGSYGLASGAFKDCQAELGSFGMWGKASGTFINCTGGDYTFGGNDPAGIFTGCQAGDFSFGWEGGEASGTYTGCRAGNRSFGGWGIASGTYTDCQAGNVSFGSAFGYGAGKASGTFINCEAGSDSFGGFDLSEGGTGSGDLSTNAVLMNCTAGPGSFGSFSMASTNFNYNASGHTFAGGPIRGDGSGLTNLNVATAISDGSIDVSKLSSNVVAVAITTNDIASWNSVGELAESIQVVSNQVSISTNLTVQGAVEAESISAAGSEGAFQFKQDGKLAGTDKLFIHEETGKPAFYAENGNLFRVYKNDAVTDENLLYSLRDEGGETVLRMFKDGGPPTVQIRGDGTIELAGQLTADGSALTNLISQPELAAFIATVTNSPAAKVTEEQVVALGTIMDSIQLDGESLSLTVTNLTVQGSVTADGSSLTNVAAGGADGTLQFNDNGVLAGNTNVFMHPTEHKLAFRSPSGNFFRGYNSETISSNTLIYSLRNEEGTSVLRLHENGQDTIRFSGDGSAYIKGDLQLDGQLIADGFGLTNINVTEAIPAASITADKLSSNSVNSLSITDGVITAADIAEDAAIELSKVDGLETIISNLQQFAATVYSNAASITVEVTDDNSANGLALIAAYASAKTMNPAADNRVAVIVPPGRYNLGTTGLQMDTPYIDVIGQTTDRDVQYLYGNPGQNNGVIKQTADYVHIENLTIDHTSTDSESLNSSNPAAYFPTVLGSNTVMRNCVLTLGNGRGLPTRAGAEVEYAGCYENCVATAMWAFGVYGAASGTFIDCTAGAESFGAGGAASGIFIGCEVTDYLGFGAGGTASGTFINCRAGEDSFGGFAMASGLFINCISSAGGSFGGHEGTASGTFINCQSGESSFGGIGGEASGRFTDCQAGQYSFGGDGGILLPNAVLMNCTAGASSFGEFDMAATNFNYNASGHTFAGGPIRGNGSGLTNLNIAALYIPRQGDLLMGSYTNGPSQ